jgi:cyclic AMP-dependent transcription factor ATF-2
LYLPQVSFTATDTSEVKTHGVLNVPRAPPLQAPPDKTTTYDSYNSNGSFSADESIDLGTSTALTQWSNTMDRKEPGDERQCGSIHVRANSTPLNTDKRRTLETVKPGSARAIYLEKNRQAASRCRTKQKRQHDELVETAQEAERKNKVLKVEVELLKSDLRDLMELVERHNECPDGRLRTYVQREGDRLCTRGEWSTIAGLLSPKGSSKVDISLEAEGFCDQSKHSL